MGINQKGTAGGRASGRSRTPLSRKNAGTFRSFSPALLEEAGEKQATQTPAAQHAAADQEAHEPTFIDAAAFILLTDSDLSADIGIGTAVYVQPFQYCAEQHALVFPARLLAQPLRHADRELCWILEKLVAAYWEIEQPSTTDQVARILRTRTIMHFSAGRVRLRASGADRRNYGDARAGCPRRRVSTESRDR